MDKELIAVMVIWESGDWLKIGPYSFKERFPNIELILIDNSPELDIELKAKLIIDLGIEIIENTTHLHTHGGGLDFATYISKEKGYEYMLVLEPDCTFHGTAIIDHFHDVKSQDWGVMWTHQTACIPHPVFSIWKLDFIEVGDSFESCGRSEFEKIEAGLILKSYNDFFYNYFDPAHKLFWKALQQGKCLKAGEWVGRKTGHHYFRNILSGPDRKTHKTPDDFKKLKNPILELLVPVKTIKR
jgi:hypothetical protein